MICQEKIIYVLICLPVNCCFLLFSVKNVLFSFIYFWLPWVFIALLGLSLVAASGCYASLWCSGFSLWWLLLLWCTGSKHTDSVVVTHRLRCSTACGIFPNQGLNSYPLHWQADSYPLCPQGSPGMFAFDERFTGFVCFFPSSIASGRKMLWKIGSHQFPSI